MHRPAPAAESIEHPHAGDTPLVEPAAAGLEPSRSDGKRLVEPAAAPIEYPSSDGKPMAENQLQGSAIMYGIGALQRHFEARNDVYVWGDMLIYYEKGNPRLSVAPDVFVVFGVEDRVRKTYLLWEEGPAPAFVLGVASPSTFEADQTTKRELYEQLGVQEYWQYDPEGTLLTPRMQGLRLTSSGYERQPVETDADGVLTMRSETLGLEMRAAPGREMRFRNPVTGLDLRSLNEAEEACLVAEARAETAEAGRQVAETGRRAAEARAETAETGRRAAEAERAAAEARVAELEALLRLRQRRD